MKVGAKKARSLSKAARTYFSYSKRVADYFEALAWRLRLPFLQPRIIQKYSVIAAWLLCAFAAASNTEKLLALLDLEQAKRQYEYHEVALPDRVFRSIGLHCDSQEPLRIAAGDEAMSPASVSIINDAGVPIFINKAGPKTIRLRPRLWDNKLRRYVQDGLPVLFLEEIYLSPMTRADRLLAVSGAGINPALVGEDTYIEFDIVQEGVRWAQMHPKCRFRVHAMKGLPDV